MLGKFQRDKENSVLKLEVLKLLKMHLNCQPYHHHVILYNFKSFKIPLYDLFAFWGSARGGGLEGVRAYLVHPPAYRHEVFEIPSSSS